MKETVKLRLKGNTFEEYTHWESMNIDSSLNNVARSFALTVTASLPSGTDVVQRISVGQKIEVLIGNDVVVSGYVDKTPLSYTATSITAGIAGRSKTGDLIDCCMAPEGTEIKKDDDSWSGTVSGQDNYEIVETNISKAVRSWNNVPCYQIIAELIAPYGIKLKISEGAKKRLSTARTIHPETDKTIKDILSELVTEQSIMLFDDGSGCLVIDEKTTNQASSQLILSLSNPERTNVLTGYASFDGSNVFTDYCLFGSAKGSATTHGASICNRKSKYHDDRVFDRPRYTNIQNSSTAENIETSAKGEADFQYSKFKAVTYTVQGWRQTSGSLWAVNQLVLVEDDVLGIYQEMLVSRVNFSLTNDDGMVTTLEVIPPEGVRNETTKTGSQKNVKSSTTSYSSFSLINVQGKEVKI